MNSIYRKDYDSRCHNRNVNLLKFAKTDASHCMQTLPRLHTFWFCPDHKVTKTRIEKQLFPHCSHTWHCWMSEATHWLLAERKVCKMDVCRHLIVYHFLAFIFFKVAGNGYLQYLSQSLIKKFTVQIHQFVFVESVTAFKISVPACSEVSIIGGKDVKKLKSWMVSIQNGEHHVCGGILIQSQWVLTSAQCEE